MRASDLAYTRLREDIVSGRLAPGTGLGEVEQSSRLGVSRTPLRGALGRLEAEELAVVGKGRTYRVSKISPNDVSSPLRAAGGAGVHPDRTIYYGLVADLDDARHVHGQREGMVALDLTKELSR